MRRVHEKAAEQRLAQWAEAHGVLSIKLNIQGRRGWPDRVFFLPGGRPYLVEMKAAGEEPRKLQLHIHSLLRAQGYMVAVHDSAEEPIAFIKRHLSLWRRFWEKVDKRGEADCWLWKGAPTNGGYGRLTLGARGAGIKQAHIVSWEFFNGPVYDELLVLHRCNNKLCVNPGHLQLGTYSENLQGAWDDGLRQREHKKLQGALNRHSKLSEAQALRLKGPLEHGMLKILAEEFGVSYALAKGIRAGRNWKHLKETK